ncbi:dihydrofolate reductase [Streptococcus gordonii]|uniref:dihydrofolate reductase n=1 Tax=Streptococcus gordonii TaxID=1302 RepID=UPI0020010239|nr:dihydrofolate reductase [Streptococcus gordonii]
MAKKIAAIWAQDQNGLIGKNQSLPWHLPAELKHFKEITSGHAILMGRVTFDGMDQRVLPNRTSLILTKDPNYTVENESVLIFHDLPSVLKWYQEQEKNLYIIGGGQIFSLFQHYLDEIIKTEIHDSFEGDTHFPKDFDLRSFREVNSQFHPKDDKNLYDFTVKVLERKGS